MRFCTRCGLIVRGGGTRHPACQVARPYNDPVHRAVSAWYRDHGTPCADCGRSGTPDNPITADHIVPVQEGGTNDLANYEPRCRECNGRKQGRSGAE